MMSTSPCKRLTSGHILGTKFLSYAKSRLPVANKPMTRGRRRAFLAVTPIPFAPLIDTHAFQPPPPYSARCDDTAECLRVPHNTPRRAHGTTNRPIGLGLEGVENGDGGRFDGLGRLGGGFRAIGASDALREQVHRMLSEHERRRRTRVSEQPTKRHDVFYASVEVQAGKRAMNCVPAVKIRIRRKSAASPTPVPRGWEGVTRGTISSELKRAASLERRASLSAKRTWR